MPFTLPELPYAHGCAGSPLSTKNDDGTSPRQNTIMPYVTNLNKALESAPDLAGLSIEEPFLPNNCAAVPENIRTAVRNNGGGHWNHSFFWKIHGAERRAGSAYGALVADAINSSFGSFDAF